MSIRHIVTWKLVTTDPAERAEQGARISELLNGLVGVVPGLIAVEVGVNSAGPETNWDVVLVSEIADEEALTSYQTHPKHLEVVDYVRSVVAERSGIDYHF